MKKKILRLARHQSAIFFRDNMNPSRGSMRGAAAHPHLLPRPPTFPLLRSQCGRPTIARLLATATRVCQPFLPHTTPPYVTHAAAHHSTSIPIPPVCVISTDVNIMARSVTPILLTFFYYDSI